MSYAQVGSVQALHRYPVKSLLGESLLMAHFEERGMVGDRLWAVEDEDGRLGSGKTSWRFRRMDGLLYLSARYEGEQPFVRFPDDHELPADSEACALALSDQFGRTVRVKRETGVSHFDDGPVHLVSTSALALLSQVRGRVVEPARMRCNILLDTPEQVGHVEVNWVGARLRLGSTVQLEIVQPMPRCVMVTMSQRGLHADPQLLRVITGIDDDVCFGVLANVLVPGEVRVGDQAALG